MAETVLSETTPSEQAGRMAMPNGVNQANPEDRDLGLAVLIIEFANGRYWPIAVISTIAEARDVAHDYWRANRGAGGAFQVWARGIRGDYDRIADFAID